MAEEKTPLQTTITNDDVRVLRVLMHTIEGISPVSSTKFISVSTDKE